MSPYMALCPALPLVLQLIVIKKLSQAIRSPTPLALQIPVAQLRVK